ncbi:DUF2497 domain-containing protein [Sphingomonas sp. 1P06PA]|uniref:DUF2497 domain-containing protein n=1 Tax=Sphingomonas sp. 1P06PA TaxID=554121 RepID=UPI0039A72797
MEDLAKEPSMEDILASIKRIIAEDNGPPPAASRARRPVIVRDPVDPPPEPEPEAAPEAAPESAEEAVLELTEPMAGDPPPAPAPTPTPATADREAQAKPAVDPIVSDTTAVASRHALAALSALVVKPQAGQENTLDGLVREMLRPMMKQWLDANLPEIVEAMVAREIQRITGRSV